MTTPTKDDRAAEIRNEIDTLEVDMESNRNQRNELRDEHDDMVRRRDALTKELIALLGD